MVQWTWAIQCLLRMIPLLARWILDGNECSFGASSHLDRGASWWLAPLAREIGPASQSSDGSNSLDFMRRAHYPAGNYLFKWQHGWRACRRDLRGHPARMKAHEDEDGSYKDTDTLKVQTLCLTQETINLSNVQANLRYWTAKVEICSNHISWARDLAQTRHSCMHAKPTKCKKVAPLCNVWLSK